jgi:2'-5' RNA ligase
MAKDKRLFLGIVIPENLGSKLLMLQEERPDIKWVRQSNLHITLRFLGEQAENVIDIVKQTIRPIKLTPTELVLTQMEFWEPNILSIGIQNNDALNSLKTQLDNALQGKVSMMDENKSFKPHVTVARVKKPVNDVDINELLQKYNQQIEKLSFTCEGYCLYESKNTDDQGRIYEKLICI